VPGHEETKRKGPAGPFLFSVYRDVAASRRREALRSLNAIFGARKPNGRLIGIEGTV